MRKKRPMNAARKKSSAVFHQEIDPRFQGSKIGMSRGNVSRLPGSRLATVQGCSCPRCPRLQGSRFKVVGSGLHRHGERFQGCGVPDLQGSRLQGSRITRLQGSKVPRIQCSIGFQDSRCQGSKMIYGSKISSLHSS